MHSISIKVNIFLFIFLIFFSCFLVLPIYLFYKEEVEKNKITEFESYIEMITKDFERHCEKLTLLYKSQDDIINLFIERFRKVYLEYVTCQNFYPFLVNAKNIIAPEICSFNLPNNIIENLYLIKKGRYKLNFGNKKGEIIFKLNEKFNLIIGYYLTNKYKYSSLIKIRSIIIFTVIPLIILFLLTSSIFFNNIFKNLALIKKFAENILNENFDYEIKIKRNDEFQSLFESLEKMKATLKEKINSLVDYKEKLLAEIKAKEKSEKRLKEAYKEIEFINKDLEEILYLAGHDFRTPILNINGFASLLKEECDALCNKYKDKMLHEDIESIKNISEYINFIQNSATHLSKLIDGLLKVIKAGKIVLKIEKLNINEIINEVLNEFMLKIKEESIEIKIQDQLPVCYGDKYYITQVFHNIISNAIKFLSNERKGLIEITGYNIENFSVYTIKDNGIGIEKKHHDKIFELFYQVNKNDKGLGVGLSIANRIIKKHNGKIEIKSQPNKGTEVLIYLPTFVQ